MASAFILRFQEPTEHEHVHDVRCGTQTGTKVAAEQADADHGRTSYNAIRHPNSSGAEGFTSESRSPANVLASIRVLMAKTTKTAVAAEPDDRDPRRERMQVIPRCSSF